MKAKEVLNILGISRATLTTYVKNGNIIATVKENGQYEYDDESVLKMKNPDEELFNVLYARVSSVYDENELTEQINSVSDYAKTKHEITVNKIITDKCNSITINRPGLNELLKLVNMHKVKTVFIKNMRTLSIHDSEILTDIIEQHSCKIISMNYKDESYDSDAMLELSEFIDKYKHNFESEKYQEKMELIAKDIKNYTK